MISTSNSNPGDLWHLVNFSDNLELEFMTIFLAWQLRVTVLVIFKFFYLCVLLKCTKLLQLQTAWNVFKRIFSVSMLSDGNLKPRCGAWSRLCSADVLESRAHQVLQQVEEAEECSAPERSWRGFEEAAVDRAECSRVQDCVGSPCTEAHAEVPWEQGRECHRYSGSQGLSRIFLGAVGSWQPCGKLVGGGACVCNQQ